MKDIEYNKIGIKKISVCNDNLNRMKRGIELLEYNNKAYESFIFMNKAIHLSRSMSILSKSKNKNMDDCNGDHSFWRPFQIGFILLNIKSIVEPESDDRNILDLLYFPTGGGKNEAYLGVIAFLMAYRRITRDECYDYDKDGGVTVIVRYTLRLTTQQEIEY